MRYLLFAVCTTGLLFMDSTAALAQLKAMQEVRFSGALSQPAVDSEGVVLRRFEVLLLTGPDSKFFSVLDDDRDGSPWPESFGQLNTAAKGPIPHLVYLYEGSAYTIALPPLSLQLPDDAQVGSSWEAIGWTFEISDADKVGEQSVWKVDARERRGRRQKLKVIKGSGLLQTASQDVFMGQGEQFELSLNQIVTKSVTEPAVQQTEQLASDLLTLQAKLARRPDTQLAELSARQITDTKQQLDNLSTLAKGTALQESVLRISQDIARQSRRVDEAMKRQQELSDKAAPEFTLKLVSGGTLESASLTGKTVVLHFWKYADKPLSEPYGQIGYLEFLFNKRKQTNVEVIGIAMNPALQQEDRLRSAVRSARKLTEFMNISYPIGYDDGSLLKAFGDPRDSGGDLPLWVVVSPAGKVVHYHSGFYEIDVREGLKQLDEIIIKQVQAANPK
jgi:peroxiredoxin